MLFQQTLLTSLLGYFTGALENQSAEVLVYGEEARTSVEASVVLPPTVEAVAGVEGVGSSAPLGENTFTAEVGGSLEDVVVFGYELGGPGRRPRWWRAACPSADGEGVASDLDVALGLDIGDVVRLGPEGEVPDRDRRPGVRPAVQRRADRLHLLRHLRGGPAAVNPDAPLVPASLVAVEPAEGVDAADAGGTDQRRGRRRRGARHGPTPWPRRPGVAETRQSFTIVFLLAYVVVAIVTGFFFLILTIQKQGRSRSCGPWGPAAGSWPARCWSRPWW